MRGLMRRLAPCSTPQRSCGASQAYRPTLQSGDTDCVAVWPPAKRSVPAPPGFLPLAGSRTILTTNPYSASFRWTRVNCWTNKSGQDQCVSVNRIRSRNDVGDGQPSRGGEASTDDEATGVCSCSVLRDESGRRVSRGWSRNLRDPLALGLLLKVALGMHNRSGCAGGSRMGSW
jgi:hypothetical protein